MDNERNYNSAKKGGSITALFIIVIAPKVMEFPQISFHTCFRPGLTMNLLIITNKKTHILINLFVSREQTKVSDHPNLQGQ